MSKARGAKAGGGRPLAVAQKKARANRTLASEVGDPLTRETPCRGRAELRRSRRACRRSRVRRWRGAVRVANTLTIRRSKTDQEAEGAVQYIGEPTVARVRACLDVAGIAAGPLFQRLDRAGRPRGRLSTVSIRAIVQRRAAEAGIEGRVSGHSLRVGGAQSLAAAGASIVEMQTADRWQSPSMPGRYARGQLAVRDRHRSEPVRRWANTHAAAERGPP